MSELNQIREHLAGICCCKINCLFACWWGKPPHIMSEGMTVVNGQEEKQFVVYFANAERI
jgi:hypothetical protein